MRISPAAAFCSRRAATLTTSPETIACRCVAEPVTACPVLIPIRISSRTPTASSRRALNPVSASRIARAAEAALRASSSRTVGTPKTAITASPMNFSTVPPCSSIRSRIRSNQRSVTDRRVSASSAPESAVEPTRSQKRTVTTLRPVGLAVTGPGAHGLPQEGQNRAPGGSGLRHEAQDMDSSGGRGTAGAAGVRTGRRPPRPHGPAPRAPPRRAVP